ncbi:MAG: hypothetical protein CMJ05_01465 [Pelagibacterales bacterium]|nr:hypothetical protein [Pelagibacterales bacterium]|tara:strand:- start:4358 stop:5470 length:1113 start_codon:yes stop_codon:yes gene_type:complete
MKLLIVLSHPGHYYLFKYLVKNLRKKGHQVDYAIRAKDVLEDILISENETYKKLCKEFYRGNSKFSIMFGALTEMIVQNIYLFIHTLFNRPDLMIGTDICISHVGSVLSISSLVFNEDDYEINKLFCKATYPFASKIISPENCSVGKFESKKIGYNGYQKIAYLHPKYFKSDLNVLKKLKLNGQKYFLIRLVTLKAVHDIEGDHSGLNKDTLKKIISLLEKSGKVFINSEGKVDADFLKYKLNIKPNEIHTVIANASLFIGDSQTMSAEAGLLGTPFIRFNDFVGKISYLNDIENKYKLGFGIKTKDKDKLFEKIVEILNIKNVKKEWKLRSQSLFSDKINVTDFWVWLVENYPKSIAILKNKPDFKNNF